MMCSLGLRLASPTSPFARNRFHHSPKVGRLIPAAPTDQARILGCSIDLNSDLSTSKLFVITTQRFLLPNDHHQLFPRKRSRGFGVKIVVIRCILIIIIEDGIIIHL